MNKRLKVWLAALCLGAPVPSVAKDCVVLLHGLARTSGSLEKLQVVLEEEGYLVMNVDYPSRQFEIPQLATIAVGGGASRCEAAQAEKSTS